MYDVGIQVQLLFMVQPLQMDNGVYSLKWRLTDRYLRWGTLADPRPGRADTDHCKTSDFLQEVRVSGFPAVFSVPHLLSRKIMMNRRHLQKKTLMCE